MSLDAFYAQREENRAALNATTSVRQVESGNEPAGEEYHKAEGDEFFIKPSKGKNRQSKPRKEKEFVPFEHRYQEDRSNEGRGGGRGRGGERGDRRGGATRGRGAPRGDGPSRGGQRGGPGGGAAPRIDDKTQFPGLGN